MGVGEGVNRIEGGWTRGEERRESEIRSWCLERESRERESGKRGKKRERRGEKEGGLASHQETLN